MDTQEILLEPERVRLAPVLNMAAARPLTEQLLAARGGDLLIDASQVQHLGAQCLQVLTSAALTWQTDRVRFAVVDPSHAFKEGARLLGLDAIFQPREAH